MISTDTIYFLVKKKNGRCFLKDKILAPVGGGSVSKRFLLQNNGTHDIEGGTQPREAGIFN